MVKVDPKNKRQLESDQSKLRKLRVKFYLIILSKGDFIFLIEAWLI